MPNTGSSVTFHFAHLILKTTPKGRVSDPPSQRREQKFQGFGQLNEVLAAGDQPW